MRPSASSTERCALAILASIAASASATSCQTNTTNRRPAREDLPKYEPRHEILIIGSLAAHLLCGGDLLLPLCLCLRVGCLQGNTALKLGIHTQTTQDCHRISPAVPRCALIAPPAAPWSLHSPAKRASRLHLGKSNSQFHPTHVEGSIVHGLGMGQLHLRGRLGNLHQLR